VIECYDSTCIATSQQYYYSMHFVLVETSWLIYSAFWMKFNTVTHLQAHSAVC